MGSAGSKVHASRVRLDNGRKKCSALPEYVIRTTHQEPADGLIAAIRKGDRAAAADYVLGAAQFIRGRARQRLSASAARIADADDVLMMVCMSFDRYVCRQRLDELTLEHVDALLMQMTDVAVLRIHRELARLARREQTLGLMRVEVASCHTMSSKADCEQLGSRLAAVVYEAADAIDFDIASMRIRGVSHKAIAGMLGVSHATIRSRWRRLRGRIRDHPAYVGCASEYDLAQEGM